MQNVKDADGVVIEIGSRVRQLNVYDADKGARAVNANQTGTVVALGRTRAHVRFDGRTKMRNFLRTDEPITDVVAGEWLRVLPDGTDGQ